jgi:hypothetical protein
MMEYYYPVSWKKPRNTIACIHHNTGSLMSVNARRWQKIVLDLFQVGVADPAALHTDEYFTGTDGGSRNHVHFNAALPCIHRCPHLSRNSESVRTRVAS